MHSDTGEPTAPRTELADAREALGELPSWLGKPETLRILLVSRQVLETEISPALLLPLLGSGMIDAVVSSPCLLEAELSLIDGRRPAAGEGTSGEGKGLVFLHDVAFERRALGNPQAFATQLLCAPPFQKIMPSATLSHLLGRYLRERGRLLCEPEGFLAAAHACGCPVYTPYLIASRLGKLLAALALDGNRLTHDPALDLNEVASLIREGQRSPSAPLLICLGGGGPLWFTLRAFQYLEDTLDIRDRPDAGLLWIACGGGSRAGGEARTGVEELLREAAPPAMRVVQSGLPASAALGALRAIASGLPPREFRRLQERRAELVERLRKAHVESTALRKWTPLKLRFPKIGPSPGHSSSA